MAIVSVVAFGLSVFVLPETLHAADRQHNPFRNGARTAATLLTQRGFVTMALVAGLVQGGMFAFITGSPSVFQGMFGLSAMQFGLMFAAIAVALIVFGRLNGRLLNHFGPEQILKAALPIFVATTITLAALSGTTSLLVFAVPLWISIGLVGLLSANAMSIAMGLTKSGAGMGSALLGAFQFAIAFVVSSCVAIGGTDTALPMSLGLLVPASLATVLFFAAGRIAQPYQSLGARP
jgi:DHA1 family bicyclomycin/chloramphenicol resistance-like MFS transporter